MIYTISNEKLTVKIDSYGAELSSIKKNGSDIEYLWQGDERSWASRASVLFPFIGRLKDKKYIYDGAEYSINSHGFARKMEFDVEDSGESYITFFIKDNIDTLKEYPFNFKFSITYSLDGNRIVKEQHIENLSNGSMLYEVGGHDGYNIAIYDGEAMSDYYFKFNDNVKLDTYAFDENLMLAKEKKDVRTNNGILDISMELFKDDALVLTFDDEKDRTVSLCNKSGEYNIQVDFGQCKYLGLWTRYLDYETKFVCIEPWTSLPDCAFLDYSFDNKIDVRKLDKGESETISYTITIM